MTELFETFELLLTVNTALHIGDGGKLVQGFDFVLEESGRKARIIDVDLALETMDESELRNARDGEIARALGERRRQQCTRAIVDVFLFADGPPNEVLACLRDPDGQPYVPGSTIKGAIRTAILRSWITSGDLNDAVSRAKRSEKGATTPGNALEAPVFERLALQGRSAERANRDVLRAIRVSDFLPYRGAPPKVAFVPVEIRRVDDTAGRKVLTVWAECIIRGSAFQGTVSLDRRLLEAAPERARHSLRSADSLLALLAEDGKRLLEAEAAWAGNAFGQWVEPAKGNLLLSVGWGTGWLAHTVGPGLRPKQRSELADALRLGRDRRTPGTPFPASYKVASVPSSYFNGPANRPFSVPLGIVALERL